MEMIYNYIQSNDFKNKVQLLVQKIISRKEFIGKEKRFYETKWKKEEVDFDIMI
jgi:hypothetical protein